MVQWTNHRIGGRLNPAIDDQTICHEFVEYRVHESKAHARSLTKIYAEEPGVRLTDEHTSDT